MADAQLVQLAKETARKHLLDPAIVCAICEQESGDRKPDPTTGQEKWNPWAIRFEPAFERRYIHPALPEAPTTEELTKAISFGVMQLMGECARELGFPGRFLSELCDPATGLEYGCKHFSNKLAGAKEDVKLALLHWNGGGDPEYPDKVMARVHKYY